MTVRTSCNFQRLPCCFLARCTRGKRSVYRCPWGSIGPRRNQYSCLSVSELPGPGKSPGSTQPYPNPLGNNALLGMSCSLLWNFETVYPHTSLRRNLCKACPRSHSISPSGMGRRGALSRLAHCQREGQWISSRQPAACERWRWHRQERTTCGI